MPHSQNLCKRRSWEEMSTCILSRDTTLTEFYSKHSEVETVSYHTIHNTQYKELLGIKKRRFTHIQTQNRSRRRCSFRQVKLGKGRQKSETPPPPTKKKTYNSRYSLVVPDTSTNLPICCLYMAERTGCPILLSLWS